MELRLSYSQKLKSLLFEPFEAEIQDTEWVKSRLEQLALIEEKRLTLICFGELYQQMMARAYNKKVRPRNFEVGQLVVKLILPHQDEAKGKFAPN